MEKLPKSQTEAKLDFSPLSIQMFQVDEERFHPVNYKAIITFTKVPLAYDMRGKRSYMSLYENYTPHQGHPEIINILSTKNCIPINPNV